MDFSTFKEGQLRCVKTLDAPVAVSAGAGSGKTFTLTQRIAWALLPGSGADGAPFLEDIDQVLAITFTDKAAGEIKSRVKATLAAEGMAAQALKVDDAWISTIHGMCSRILRMHATELGIDPAFSVLDEATAFADPENEAALIKALAAAMRGRTVIMVAHRLSMVTQADVILLFSDGQLREMGNHTQLLAQGGLYQRLWQHYQQAQHWVPGGTQEEVVENERQ